jgi:hypothetical protein
MSIESICVHLSINIHDKFAPHYWIIHVKVWIYIIYGNTVLSISMKYILL